MMHFSGRILLLVFLTALFSNVAFAQDFDAWNARLEQAEELLNAPDSSTDALDDIRLDLAEQRSEAQSLLEQAQSRLTDIRSQIEALGPVPENGGSEAEEVAQHRAQLASDLKEAQIPLLAAQTAHDAAEKTLNAIDTHVRARFSGELITLGPSPLVPDTIATALGDLGTYLGELKTEVIDTFENNFRRNRMLSRLPFAIVLFGLGLLFLFGMRKRQVVWVQSALERSDHHAWLGAALNLGRLVVPMLGAIALIAGIKTLRLFGPTGDALIATLPVFAASLIIAYWIGHSVFAPVLPQFRLVPIDDDVAERCSKLTLALGILAGLYFVLNAVFRQFETSQGTVAVLTLPLVALAAMALWRLAALIRPTLAKSLADSQDDDSVPVVEPFGLNMLRLLRRSTVVVTIATPLLALIGYGNAARYLLFATILTLAVLGGAYVCYIILNRTMSGFTRVSTPQDPTQERRAGLLPVLFGFILSILSLPILALIWGARRSDLLEMWVWARDGVTIGGSRVSLTDFMVFLLIFGIGYGITRFLQSLMRRTVLPRTKLDVGGQNAVATGIGYLGIFLAGLLAVTSTGLDLSSLAIVAGALSLGVGFGLQTIVSNFVSGIILLVERPIKQGDWIEVAGYSGYVRDISVRSTSIETFDKATVIVPNQELIAGSVLNWTHGSMAGRVIIPIGVAYGTDPRKVQEILMEIATSHPLVLRRPGPAVLFIGFGADSLDFEIRAHLRDVNYMLSARSDMNFAICKRFEEEGIEIPFAQRDINLRNVDEIAKAFAPKGNA